MIIQGRFLEYLDAAEEALSQYGPAVVDATLMWARVDAASGLIVPFFGSIACAVLWAWPMRFILGKALRVKGIDHNGEPERDPFYVITTITFLPVLAVLTIHAAAGVLDLWRWVGVFVPELWLMHKAISAISGGA